MTPRNIRNKRLAGLFILGWVIFNYPILSLFNREIFVFGIPLLYVFLFLAWSLFVVILAFVTLFRPKATLSDAEDQISRAKKTFSTKTGLGKK